MENLWFYLFILISDIDVLWFKGEVHPILLAPSSYNFPSMSSQLTDIYGYFLFKNKPSLNVINMCVICFLLYPWQTSNIYIYMFAFDKFLFILNNKQLLYTLHNYDLNISSPIHTIRSTLLVFYLGFCIYTYEHNGLEFLFIYFFAVQFFVSTVTIMLTEWNKIYFYFFFL